MAQQAMTAFAQAALAVSDLVAAKFSGTRFSGSIVRLVKVQAPNVPSTGGGKQARESVILMPENGDTAQAITAGFIDVGLRSVEIRTFAALDQTYQQRHKTKLDIPKAEYDGFMKEMQTFLGGEGYIVKTVDVSDQDAKATKAQAASENASEQPSSKTPIIVAGVAILAILAVVAVVFLK
ncbi:MAG: hypothetical protein Q8O67_04205 [Deltaproteobacteria bacterium]|nr:hypothetical protein [Deltaproteobacteria bacterium]